MMGGLLSFKVAVTFMVVLTVSVTNAKKEDTKADGKAEDAGVDVQFVLSARELPGKKGILGQSGPDPYVEMEYFEKLKGEESRTYATSILSGTANPEWPDIIRVKFHNGQGQRIKFSVKDGHSEIAHVSASLKSIVNATASTLELELVGPNQKNGRLIINTLINETPTDETVERLASSKTKDTKLLIDLDKKPKKKKKKSHEDEDDD